MFNELEERLNKYGQLNRQITSRCREKSIIRNNKERREREEKKRRINKC